MSNRAWKNDNIQFARLLSEIVAVGLTDEQKQELCESMDLLPHELDELFDRAENKWNNVILGI